MKNSMIADYLAAFRLKAVAASIPDRTPGQNWYALPPLVKGSHISLSVGCSEIQVNLNNDIDADRSRFDALWSQREDLQQELGDQIIWDNKPGRKKTALRVTHQVGYEDTATWDAQHRWGIATMKQFEQSFGRRLA